MPFAPSIMYEESMRYLAKRKPHILSPYMILSFDTHPERVNEIRAAVHPYDMTARPQEVKREWNPSYYTVLEEFADITGTNAILNTSFNLHGHPIVYSPSEAIQVFENSGLKWLSLGHVMIEKTED